MEGQLQGQGASISDRTMHEKKLTLIVDNKDTTVRSKIIKKE